MKMMSSRSSSLHALSAAETWEAERLFEASACFGKQVLVQALLLVRTLSDDSAENRMIHGTLRQRAADRID
jgi:hypothetical protein